MALSQHDLTELLESLRAADSVEMVRRALQRMLQELIEAEATTAIGAAPYQRSPERTTHRNGHRERTLSSTAGDLELQIPKLRSGSFFPSLLERRRRIDRALFAVIMEAYVHGVSTRAVDDLTPYLGQLRLEQLKVSDIALMFEQIEEFNDTIAERRADLDPQGDQPE